MISQKIVSDDFLIDKHFFISAQIDKPNHITMFFFGFEKKASISGDVTDWPQVRLIAAILFLGCIQMFVIGMSEWPYMQEVFLLCIF